MSIDDRTDTGPPPAGVPHEVRSKHRVLPPPVTGQEVVLIGVLVVLWVILAFATPAFLSAELDPAAAGHRGADRADRHRDDRGDHHRRHRRLGRGAP